MCLLDCVCVCTDEHCAGALCGLLCDTNDVVSNVGNCTEYWSGARQTGKTEATSLAGRNWGEGEKMPGKKAWKLRRQESEGRQMTMSLEGKANKTVRIEKCKIIRGKAHASVGAIAGLNDKMAHTRSKHIGNETDKRAGNEERSD